VKDHHRQQGVVPPLEAKRCFWFEEPRGAGLGFYRGKNRGTRGFWSKASGSASVRTSFATEGGLTCGTRRSRVIVKRICLVCRGALDGRAARRRAGEPACHGIRRAASGCTDGMGGCGGGTRRARPGGFVCDSCSSPRPESGPASGMTTRSPLRLTPSTMWPDMDRCNGVGR
jgi:hypothetical protein